MKFILFSLLLSLILQVLRTFCGPVNAQVSMLDLYLSEIYPASQLPDLNVESGSMDTSFSKMMCAAAAAAAKSLYSCLTLCDPIDGSPPGSPVPGILQARTTGVGCHFLLQCMKMMCSLPKIMICFPFHILPTLVFFAESRALTVSQKGITTGCLGLKI